MTGNYTIEQFNILLHSEKNSGSLMEALFKITTIEGPEVLLNLTNAGIAAWAYWQ
jgi:hypothetical protein